MANKTIDMLADATLDVALNVVVGDGATAKKKTLGAVADFVLARPAVTQPVGDSDGSVASTEFVQQNSIINAIIFG
jgi:hypothetical protein